MYHLPLIPRFKKIYVSINLAPHMRWHSENKKNDDVMTYPSHVKLGNNFDWTYSDFASDTRNIILGFYPNEFTSNNWFNKLYSCWLVICTLFNLSSEIYMKDPYLFLTYIILGLNNPIVKIDIQFQPLIDKLNKLWYESVLNYDISTKQNSGWG